MNAKTEQHPSGGESAAPVSREPARRASPEYLCPYKSLILTELTAEAEFHDKLVDDILDDMVGAFGLDANDPNLQLVQKSAIRMRGKNIEAGFLQFVQLHPPAWTTEVGLVDRVNHLALVFRQEQAVALYVSDPAFRQQVMRRIDEEDALGLSLLKLIPRSRLNAAFVRGKARTLWLSGIHRRTVIKADSKILAGSDLQEALNPLDDQTYGFTAARCATKLAGRDITVGSVPRESRIWIGPSKDWSEFCRSTSELLTRVQKTQHGVTRPLPILARPVTDTTGVRDAFDVSFQPPHMTGPGLAPQPAQAQGILPWASDGSFEVLHASRADVTARLKLMQRVIGIISFHVNLKDPENVGITATGVAADPAVKSEFEQALALCNRPEWINIRYDSGHTITGGAVLEVDYRDMPFTNFWWADFRKWEIDLEKPTPLSAIGKQRSLFCWVRKHWPHPQGAAATGWLACDDGSMEIADFIHLETRSPIPILTLIHVKGAGDTSPTRGISVSKYEVVVGQAVKNLRYLDRLILAEGLRDGLDKKISSMVWKDRKRVRRADFLRALGRIGSNFQRRVVIVQPHVTRARRDFALKNPDSPDAARLRQLDTLLVGAEMNCRGLGAELFVVASK